MKLTLIVLMHFTDAIDSANIYLKNNLKLICLSEDEIENYKKINRKIYPICIDGDGGFFMNIQELELVYRYQLPIKFFILNNDGYGSIKTTQNTHFKGNLVVSDPSSGLTLPSIELNAAAYKIPYVKIETQQNLKLDLSNVLSMHGPIICELIVDPDHKTLPKASVYKKEDGSFATRPMEDLAPFLDRNEFLNNFIKNEKPNSISGIFFPNFK